MSPVESVREYDLQLTRRYHSTMFIHGSLDTGAFSLQSPLHYTSSIILTCPQTLASPLPPVVDKPNRELIPLAYPQLLVFHVEVLVDNLLRDKTRC